MAQEEQRILPRQERKKKASKAKSKDLLIQKGDAVFNRIVVWGGGIAMLWSFVAAIKSGIHWVFLAIIILLPFLGIMISRKVGFRVRSQIFVVSLLMTVSLWFGFHLWKTWPQPSDISRPLKPAHDSLETFLSGASVPALRTNEVIFFFGSCWAILPLRTNGFPLVITPSPTSSGLPAVRLVEVALDESGATVSGQFFDKAGRIVAVLKHNKPIINSETAWQPERPDGSTLIVRDKSNVEVLNIRFLSSNAFTFSGTLRSPDGGEVVINKSAVEFITIPWAVMRHSGSRGATPIMLTTRGNGNVLMVDEEHLGLEDLPKTRN